MGLGGGGDTCHTPARPKCNEAWKKQLWTKSIWVTAHYQWRTQDFPPPPPRFFKEGVLQYCMQAVPGGGGGGGYSTFNWVGECRGGGGLKPDPVSNRSAHKKYTLSQYTLLKTFIRIPCCNIAHLGYTLSCCCFTVKRNEKLEICCVPPRSRA